MTQLYFNKKKEMKIKNAFLKAGLKQSHLQINKNQNTSTKGTSEGCTSGGKKIIPQKVCDKIKQ